jgi:DNA-binding NarL/FixJ family response regulator
LLLKATPPDRLTAGIETVAAGDALVAPGLTRRMIEEHITQPPPGLPAHLAALTERERQVLVLVAQGLSNADIATHLLVTEATVKTHINRILGKLCGCARAFRQSCSRNETGLLRPGQGARR